MNKDVRKRTKAIVGGIVYLALAIGSQIIIRRKITRKPHVDIAIQLSNAFHVICYILYSYYINKEE